MGDEEADDMERQLDTTAIDLLDELAEIEQRNAILPGEFTIDDYVGRVGISRRVAHYRLKHLVADGTLKMRKVARGGCSCNVYSRVVDDAG